MTVLADIYKQYYSSKLKIDSAFEVVCEELVQEKNLTKKLQEEINKLKEGKD